MERELEIDLDLKICEKKTYCNIEMDDSERKADKYELHVSREVTCW